MAYSDTQARYSIVPFADEHFEFFGKRLSGATEQRPRWKRVMTAVDMGIGEDLGQLYVKKAFSLAAKERALAMLALIKQAMRQRIAEQLGIRATKYAPSSALAHLWR